MPKTDKVDVTPLTAPIAAFNPAAAQAWTEIATDCARFAMSRVQTDIATQSAMMTCGTPAEWMKLQADYMRDTIQQYSEQSARVVELMSAAMGQPSKGGRSAFSRKYDDIPL